MYALASESQATEVDPSFNANVVTHSDGRLRHGIGGWQNCMHARCTILSVPAMRDRMPVIVDEVTTLCAPGELVDVIVTEFGIAVNPLRQDLLDAVKGKGLPVRPIQDIKAEVEHICGKPSRRARQNGDCPAPLVPTVPRARSTQALRGTVPSLPRIVAVVKWVDGTVLDSVYQVT